MHKEGGVYKLLILLAVPQVQELYANMNILLNELGLVNIDFSLASDLKMGRLHCQISDNYFVTV